MATTEPISDERRKVEILVEICHYLNRCARAIYPSEDRNPQKAYESTATNKADDLFLHWDLESQRTDSWLSMQRSVHSAVQLYHSGSDRIASKTALSVIKDLSYKLDQEANMIEAADVSTEELKGLKWRIKELILISSVWP